MAIKSRIFQFDWYKKKIGVENFPKIRTKVSKYYFKERSKITQKKWLLSHSSTILFMRNIVLKMRGGGGVLQMVYE